MKQFFLSMVLLLVVGVGQVRADFMNCTVEFSASSIQAHQSGAPLTISVTNNTDIPLGWIHITKSVDDLAMHAEAPNGWTLTGDTQSLEFTGGSLGFGRKVNLPLTIDIAGNYDASGSWYVEAGSASGADDIHNCNGDTSLTVVSQALDITPPVLSQLEVTINSESQVTMAWKTDERATSKVEYGTISGVKNLRGEYNKDFNGAYSYTKDDQTLTMDHSLVLTDGVAVGQTYYYQVSSTDASGNQVIVGEFTFVTGVGSGTTVTQTVTVTNTITATNNHVNTVVQLIVDSIPPVVSLTNKWEPFYSTAPTITGKATDNKAVVAMEYSIDKGKNWRPLELTTRGAATSFSFTPPISEEGNYDLVVRAYDAEGNKGASQNHTIVIDRLPPLFGATYLSWGSGLQIPATDAQVTAMVGSPLQLTLSAVGGPTSIKITNNQLPASPAGGPISNGVELVKDEVSGRWIGTLKFDTPGDTVVSATGVDGNNRTTTSDLFPVTVLPAGTVVDQQGKPIDATVTVYIKDPVTGNFSVWDGRYYEQQNPSKTSSTSGQAGQFGLVLPAGTYYIKIQDAGFRIQESKIFELSETGLVRAAVVMTPQHMVSLGSWKLMLPDWWSEGFVVETMRGDLPVQAGATSGEANKDLWGKSLPDMTLETETGDVVHPADWVGKMTIIMLDAPWLPTIGDSMVNFKVLATNFDKARIVWVAAQSTTSSLQGIEARSGLVGMTVLADRDAALTSLVDGHQLPMVILVDRLGIIRGMYRGTAPNEVIQKLMEE